MRDEMRSQVTRLGIFSTAAGYVTVVLARATLGKQGAVGTDAGAAPGPSQQIHV
jgi:hypothetical protein